MYSFEKTIKKPKSASKEQQKHTSNKPNRSKLCVAHFSTNKLSTHSKYFTRRQTPTHSYSSPYAKSNKKIEININIKKPI